MKFVGAPTGCRTELGRAEKFNEIIVAKGNKRNEGFAENFQRSEEAVS